VSAPGCPVRIIAIGDELLEGRTVDSNSQRIQRALGQHGVRVVLIQVVADDETAVRAALDRTEAGDVVFVSGGLGSTPDDKTRDMIAAWADVDLVEDAGVRQELTARWRRLGRTLGRTQNVGVSRQCQVPQGMTPLTNQVGSAPGLVGVLRQRHLVLLPGVPAELAGLLPVVIGWLDDNGVLPRPCAHRMWRTAQISELALVRLCEPVRQRFPGLRWSWWLSEWGVDVRLSASDAIDESVLDQAEQMLSESFGRLVYGRGDASLPLTVKTLMTSAGTTLSVAESCTSGLLGGALTAEAGASEFFRGGLLTYADEAKHRLLGVPRDILQSCGAVSEETVRFMAAGCREKVATDYAIAVSGISGPGGGNSEKPVGVTWIAVASPSRLYAHCYRFPADRQRNRQLAVAAATDALRRLLEYGDEHSPWAAGDTWCAFP